MEANGQVWLNLAQAARYVGASKSLISKAIRKGHLRASPIGEGKKRHSWRLRIEWLDEWVARPK
jgi:excisionase family DNA binding protein